MSLSAIGISCKDVDLTIKFYSKLGISFNKLGEGHYEGSTSSGLRVMLDSFELLKKINPKWKEPKQPGVTLCFLQNTPSQVNDLYSLMTSEGFTSIKGPWDAFWGQRYASILDPNGNQVDIFSPL